MRLLKFFPIFLILISSNAAALTTLKKVQVTDGNQIDLFFDKPVKERQIRTEFFRDIIQLSLDGVSVYPAKITSVSGIDLKKVFAYQYTPKTVRCRLTVDGKAEDFEGKVNVKANGKRITIRIDENKKPDQVALSSAKSMTAGEMALLEKVKKGGQASNSSANSGANSGGKAEPSSSDLSADEEAPTRLTNSKPLPSPLRAFMALGVVLLVFGAIIAFLRKWKRNSSLALTRHKGLKGLLSGMGGLKLGKGNEKFVEIISNHYLGPKKSIAVARIAGRVMVLGITDESINLITEVTDEGALLDDEDHGTQGSLQRNEGTFSERGPSLGPSFRARAQSGSSANIGGAGATSASRKPVFSDLLNSEVSKPNIRAQIRSRLEGFKSL